MLTWLSTLSQELLFESWLSSCSECTEQVLTSARSALNKARKVTSWADSHKDDIWKALRNDARKVSSSAFILAVCFIGLVFDFSPEK